MTTSSRTCPVPAVNGHMTHYPAAPYPLLFPPVIGGLSLPSLHGLQSHPPTSGCSTPSPAKMAPAKGGSLPMSIEHWSSRKSDGEGIRATLLSHITFIEFPITRLMDVFRNAGLFDKLKSGLDHSCYGFVMPVVVLLGLPHPFLPRITKPGVEHLQGTARKD
ncbi:retinoic acid receptor beta isoform x1 [Limosa lapponica baueri]|uniref:Retinoic acid receptor beta isoform x1 n=1 Tax=Limosa lapponica baueri TaxID=1758121 RepID=A0A2I0UK26_LIMLA|nr:retinoic acid receptor beta isoform x1 [Limosa lapponica baueri]